MTHVYRWILLFIVCIGIGPLQAVVQPSKIPPKKLERKVTAPKKQTTVTEPPKQISPISKQQILKSPSTNPTQKVSPDALKKVADQKLIVLDPGHGGYDVGARYSSCDEKSLALSMALLTKKHLTDMGYRVILTRSRDVFIPLETRASIANDTKGKLFVSIHCNAAKNSLAKGIEVFYYTSGDKWRSASSKKLASRILSKVIEKTGADDRGVKEGNFFVLRETKMPSIIVETGFMTHTDEVHLLKDIVYRNKIARGISEGIDNYFKP